MTNTQKGVATKGKVTNTVETPGFAVDERQLARLLVWVFMPAVPLFFLMLKSWGPSG